MKKLKIVALWIVVVILPTCALWHGTQGGRLKCDVFENKPGHIWFHAKINGQPVKLIIDTGTECSILWRSAAKRLKLAVTEPPPDIELQPGEIKLGITEEFDLTVGDSVSRGLRFHVAESPPAAFDVCDGLFGWDYLKQNVTSIDWDRKSIEVSPKVRTDVQGWSSWLLSKETKMAAIDTGAPGKSCPLVFLDSGGVATVSVAQKHWKELIEKDIAAPATLGGFYTPFDGFVVEKQRWANLLQIGKLALENVLVAPLRHAYHPREEATLPIEVLRRFNLVIDGPNNVIYMKPREDADHSWSYNRIAAVFIPRDLKSDALIAHVIENGPAYRAGVRPGDELVRIGKRDVTKWRTEPKVYSSSFWEMAPGTRLNLGLLRDDKPLEVWVTLETLFPAAEPKRKEKKSPEP